jgi:membrane-bound metal-dependent hydrolase YbcI (DUF457 family)
MDTITHGIAGALISKAAFGGSDLLPPKEIERRAITSWALMLGAIFPDSDVLRDLFSKDQLLVLTWHRSITHSLVCLPIWAALLAYLTGVIARRRKWEAPSFRMLTGLYALGILSHIFLDLVTSFGTMIWSPLEWSRPAWDLLMIIDFSFTAILLIPQLLAWAYSDAERVRWRVTLLWVIFTPAPLLVSRLAESVGRPMSGTAVLVATVLMAALFLLPAVRGRGLRVGYAVWNRVGLSFAAVYLACAAFAHHAAFEGVKQFAAEQRIEALAVGALPMPPSLWHWDGLVLAPRGVYETHIDLGDDLFRNPSAHDPIEHTYYPSAFPNQFIESARKLHQVQEVLWFARFPVTRFHKEGDEAVVEISDMRFPQFRRDRPPSFTYRVRFSADGQVLSQGWVRQ